MSKLLQCNKHSLFGGFSDEDIKRVEDLFEIHSYMEKDFLITENQANDKIFFLLEGLVRVTHKDRTLIEFKDGDSFGEIEMLDTKPATASVQALSVTKAACLGHTGLYGMYRLDTRLYSLFMMNLARDLARRLRRMNELI